MENLFIEDPVFEKTSSTRISEDSSQWVKEILTYFQESFPELASQPVRISFTQKDEGRGYGVGAIYVGNGNVKIPIIVEEFNLNDLDVAVINNTVVPLTRDSVQILFNSKSAFSKVVPSDEVDQVTRLFSRNLHTPEESDKYAELSLNISKEKLEEFVEATSKYKNSFEKNGTWDIVQGFAETEGDSEILTNNQVEKLLPRNIYTIEKTGNYEYTAFLGNSDVDNRIEVKLKEEDVREAHALLEKSASVKEYKEFNLPSTVESIAPIVNFDGSETNLEIFADKNCNYNVKEATISTKSTPTGKFAIVMNKKMPSTSKKKALTDPTTANGSVKTAQKNDFGTFLTKNGATKPIFIENIAKVNGRIEIEGFDGLNSVKLATWKGIKKPKFDEEKNTYFWPMSTQFVKLGNLKENLYDFPENSPSGDWILRVDSDFYAFGGPNFEKYAELGHNINDVDYPNSKWYMIQLGVAPNELEKIALKEGERHYFSSNLNCPRSFNDYVTDWNEKVGEALRSFDDSELDLIKEAAVMDDGITVDALLSLRFLNKENLGQFIDAIPLFEEVASKLSQLLISVRLGLSSIPQMAVKKAMENLTTVTAKLYELQTLLKNAKK